MNWQSTICLLGLFATIGWIVHCITRISRNIDDFDDNLDDLGNEDEDLS